ncbi:MAG: hypothetical protein NTX66_03475 [Candidatus Falkowbacteria bacterium]|nr:hypothetical protein [Candidatus Falkowbacteria bacterium]
MLWLNFLHLYQPANLDVYYIKEAADKSYRRLVNLLDEHKTLKFTLNISACLLLRLEDAGYQDLLDRLAILIKRGQVELVGSAAYHAFLPLLPEAEIVRQIKEQEKIIKKYFGPIKLRGFFSPEMAYSDRLAKIVRRLGYQWIILDEIALGGRLNKSLDFKRMYLDRASGLKVIFRERDLSNSYVPESVFDLVKKGTRELAITATDGELYGLRHEDPTAELEKLVKLKDLKTQTISEFIKSFKTKDLIKVNLTPSTWESTNQELSSRRPFWLWRSQKNKIQNYSWRLAELALSLDPKYKNDKNYYYYRWHLERGLASCTFWWASGRDFFHNFGPLAWSPDEVERGLNDLIRSVRSLVDPKTKPDKIKAEKLYIKAKGLLWHKHWEEHF